MALYNMVNEIVEDGHKRQGCDMLGYIRNVVCIKLYPFSSYAIYCQLVNNHLLIWYLGVGGPVGSLHQRSRMI